MQASQRIQAEREIGKVSLFDRSLAAREVLGHLRETQLRCLRLQLSCLLLQSDHSGVRGHGLAGESMPPPL